MRLTGVATVRVEDAYCDGFNNEHKGRPVGCGISPDWFRVGPVASDFKQKYTWTIPPTRQLVERWILMFEIVQEIALPKALASWLLPSPIPDVLLTPLSISLAERQIQSERSAEPFDFVRGWGWNDEEGEKRRSNVGRLKFTKVTCSTFPVSLDRPLLKVCEATSETIDTFVYSHWDCGFCRFR